MSRFAVVIPTASWWRLSRLPLAALALALLWLVVLCSAPTRAQRPGVAPSLVAEFGGTVRAGVREHRGRAVLLTAWPDRVPPRSRPPGWLGGELLLLDTVGTGAPAIRIRHAVPCCTDVLLGEGDELVIMQTGRDERAAWLRLGPGDEVASPVALLLGTDGLGNRTKAAAVYDGALWTIDSYHRAQRIRLAAEPSTGPARALPDGAGPALLLPAGDRLLYALPHAFGWLAAPADPVSEPPTHGVLPLPPSRRLEAIVPVDDGAIVASDGAPLLFAPTEPGATLEDMAGVGNVDQLRELHVDGELLYARRSGQLWHWRRAGPRSLRPLGRLEIGIDGGSLSIHAADEGLLAFSSDKTLVVLRPSGNGGARRVAITPNEHSWSGRTRIRDGTFWLLGSPLGLPLGLRGLHVAGDSVSSLIASFSFPGGGRLADQVAWDGDLAMVGIARDIWLIDMTDPLDPRPIGQIDLPGSVVAIALEDATAWVAWESPRGTRLGLFDLSMPAFPNSLGPDLPLAAEDVLVDIRMHAGEAWLLVDDALQLRRLPTAPGATATATRPSTVTPTPTADGRRVWLPWAER